jgi:hypothetical protein
MIEEWLPEDVSQTCTMADVDDHNALLWDEV